VLDTAAVADRTIDLFLGPNFRDALRAGLSPLGSPNKWIATFCGLHDLGKYQPSFQALRFESAKRRFGDMAAADLRMVRKRPGLGRRVDAPHGLVTAMHMKDLLKSWGASASAAERIAVAIGGHHGHFPDASALQQARREVNNHGRATWQGWRDDLVHEVIRLRGLPDPSTLPWQDVYVSLDAAVGLAALTTLSDWIASDTANFPYADVTDLAAYVAQADRLADAAVERLRLRPWTPPARFTELFDNAPRPIQTLVDRLTADRTEPTLVLVEAPTGEGKSKAALQAAAALTGNLGLLGAYVAMPTKATSLQMRKELEHLIEKLGQDVYVGLIHSDAKAVLEAEAASPTGVGEDDPDDSDVAAREWFTRKKNLLTTVGVGTVDQALKAVFRSGHVFVRLAALTNKVVVIDEIHAYDTYMSTLLDRLLTWLGRLGVPVVMLSATLPAQRRQELVAAWQSGLLRCLPRQAPVLPSSAGYPRVTVAGTGRPIVESTTVSGINAGRTLQLTHVPDEEIVDWALASVANGGSAAIMHNLVRRARATYTALEERIAKLPESSRPELILIHGQLAGGQRNAIEAKLSASFGPQGTRPKAIVVSTQVLEQGLDLDFDAMLTDLAPVDWLIQRAGRLHRHRRDPARGEPVLAITGVTDTEQGPRFPPHATRVYALIVLLRTWALLRERASIALPDEVPTLVDAVYGPADAITCPAGWEQAWQSAAAQLDRARERSTWNARVNYLPLPNAVEHLSELTKNSKNPSRTRENRRGS
jgi:CRISPR-associated endonuclease/helicase Cas3